MEQPVLLLDPASDAPDYRALEEAVLGDVYFARAIRFAFERIGSVAGRTVVDMGCGRGRISVYMALHGARVVGFDINEASLAEARELAAKWNVADRCRFLCCRSEAMALDTHAADLIFSRSTLQYADRVEVFKECLRVLRPGGSLILLENLPHSPFINLYRVWRRRRARRPEDVAYVRSIRGYLTHAEVRRWEDQFAQAAHKDFHLLAVPVIALRRKYRRCPVVRAFNSAVERLDDCLFAALPFTRRLAWLVAVVGTGKKDNAGDGPRAE
jgi:ubiquinone/menaquinone biosynthesis C-methylase UbiE